MREVLIPECFSPKLVSKLRHPSAFSVRLGQQPFHSFVVLLFEIFAFLKLKVFSIQKKKVVEAKFFIGNIVTGGRKKLI